MNLFIWALAGGALGWFGVNFGYNDSRGRFAAVFIGAIGGIIGGKLLAPMFTAVPAVPADFSFVALLFAMAVATAALYVGEFVSDRYGY